MIAIAAFSIMFGTCIAVFDGYSRAMTATIRLIRGKQEREDNGGKELKTLYRIMLLVSSFGAFLLILSYDGNPGGFQKLVNLATSMSFVMAPAIAIFNLILVNKKHIGKEFAPPLWIRIIAWLGVMFLIIFSVFYIFKDHFLSN